MSSASVDPTAATVVTAPASVIHTSTSVLATPTPVAIPSPTVIATPSITAPETPTAANPNPAPIPTPVTRCPVIIRAWSHWNDFRLGRWRCLVRWHQVRGNRLLLLAVGISRWRILIPQRTVVGQHRRDDRRR